MSAQSHLSDSVYTTSVHGWRPDLVDFLDEEWLSEQLPDDELNLPNLPPYNHPGSRPDQDPFAISPQLAKLSLLQNRKQQSNVGCLNFLEAVLDLNEEDFLEYVFQAGNANYGGNVLNLSNLKRTKNVGKGSAGGGSSAGFSSSSSGAAGGGHHSTNGTASHGPGASSAARQNANSGLKNHQNPRSMLSEYIGHDIKSKNVVPTPPESRWRFCYRKEQVLAVAHDKFVSARSVALFS
ncbi:unnamed protein product [Amoebophrya sp. A120]|nr:unnamed protein product [Amoebophrya sp. A120]|eukprot:GSA120T00004662001.1